MVGPRIAGAGWAFRARRLERAPLEKSCSGGLTYRAHFVKAMHAGYARIAGPVIGSALPPTVDPVLSCGGAVEGAGILRLAMYSILVPAEECSFHRITLQSSHKVEPSLDMTNPPATSEAGDWHQGKCPDTHAPPPSGPAACSEACNTHAMALLYPNQSGVSKYQNGMNSLLLKRDNPVTSRFLETQSGNQSDAHHR